MNHDALRKLLDDVKHFRTSVDEALEKIRDIGAKEFGFATIDTHRELRTGYPEVIFGQGKSPEQVASTVSSCIVCYLSS